MSDDMRFRNVSRPRRVVSKFFYFACLAFGLVAIGYLFIDFGGNVWPLTAFGAIICFIIGNAVAYPPGDRGTARTSGTEQPAQLSNEELHRIALEKRQAQENQTPNPEEKHDR